ncbi:MAG TPA: Ig-like domain-containing protein [Candidatus Limnocylindrales bacterium]
MTRSRRWGRCAVLVWSIGLAVASSLTAARPTLAIGLVAVNDSASVIHDRTLTVAAPGVLGNDLNLLGDTTAVLVSGPSHGTLNLSSTGAYTYRPAAGYVGQDTFRYHDCCLLGLPSTAATVTITVTNRAPVAVDDAYSMTSGGTLHVPAAGVLANDLDADGDALTASLVDGGGNGSLDLASDGSFTFKPGGSFSGKRTFTYRASDGAASSGTATVTIDVQKPAATPTPTPTPRPTPTPTPRPSLPLPSLPLPSLPLPSLPLPTLPLPTLPLPTLFPTPTPAPTRTPAPTGIPAGATPTPAPGAATPTAPTATAGAGTPSPGASTPPGGIPSAGTATPTPAGPPGGGTTTGGGPGAGGAQPPIDEGVVVGPLQAPPIDDLVDVNVVGLDGLIEWAVPSLILSVPGLLLILAVVAQAVVGTLWVPIVRRWLGTFGMRDRRARTAHP